MPRQTDEVYILQTRKPLLCTTLCIVLWNASVLRKVFNQNPATTQEILKEYLNGNHYNRSLDQLIELNLDNYKKQEKKKTWLDIGLADVVMEKLGKQSLLDEIATFQKEETELLIKQGKTEKEALDTVKQKTHEFFIHSEAYFIKNVLTIPGAIFISSVIIKALIDRINSSQQDEIPLILNDTEIQDIATSPFKIPTNKEELVKQLYFVVKNLTIEDLKIIAEANRNPEILHQTICELTKNVARYLVTTAVPNIVAETVVGLSVKEVAEVRGNASPMASFSSGLLVAVIGKILACQLAKEELKQQHDEESPTGDVSDSSLGTTPCMCR